MWVKGGYSCQAREGQDPKGGERAEEEERMLSAGPLTFLSCPGVLSVALAPC